MKLRRYEILCHKAVGESDLEIKGIIWIDEILEKPLRKQNVRQHQVKEVLTNQPRFRFVEKGHRSGENVYVGSDRWWSISHCFLCLQSR